MARSVKTLIAGLSLPNGNYYPLANTIVTLTDDEYGDLDPAIFTRGWLQDLGFAVNGSSIYYRQCVAGAWPVRGTLPSDALVIWVKRSAADPDPAIDNIYMLAGVDILLKATA